MRKDELIKEVSKTCRRSQIDCEAVINALCDVIIENVKSGEEVTLIGVGKFSKKTRSPRVGMNPATGQSLIIPSKVVPVFTAAKKLKEELNA